MASQRFFLVFPLGILHRTATPEEIVTAIIIKKKLSKSIEYIVVTFYVENIIR